MCYTWGVIEYLSGYFDADGTIGIRRPSGRSHYLVMSVNGVDPAPLYVFQERWGGWVYARGKPVSPDHRQMYEWQVRPSPSALSDLLPFLIVKRLQVQVSLRFLRECPSNRGRKLTPQQVERREVYRSLLAKLKRLPLTHAAT